MLTGKQVANSILKSTERYVSYLDDQEKGVERHQVHDIQTLADGQQLLEGSVWHTYACETEPGLRLRANTGAVLERGSLPNLEARILHYDRRSGAAEIATREPAAVSTGQLLVDFRWLVRRTLEWYRERGSSIPDLNGIPAPSLPPLTPLADSGLSIEQEDAIETALSTAFSYIWGPPGTGKTKWVLAKAVDLCVREGEKALILAPTNNAVDNALRAVLDEGVSQHSVMRLGVPTRQFLSDFPECCEERAFASEIAEISAETRVLENRIAKITAWMTLKETSENLNESLTTAKRNIEIQESERTQLASLLSEAEEQLAELKAALAPREKQIKGLEADVAGLQVSQLREAVESLEFEQARVIKERSEVREVLVGMSIFARLIPGRKRRLKQQLASTSAHLESVEKSLQGRRAKLEELLPTLSALEAQLSELNESCKAEWNGEKALKQETQQISARTGALESSISSAKSTCASLQDELSEVEAQLATSEDIDPGSTDIEAELQNLTSRREVLSSQLLQFRQDIAVKSVLGMTLDSFIGMTLQMGLSVDRVFVDEAPYAPLAKCIPLLSLRKPITLLGDHLQLPPICECRNDTSILAYWGKPSVFLEDIFLLEGDASRLHELPRPCFNLMKKMVLSRSYRFGQSLATLLDTHVYSQMGLTGVAEQDTFIECVSCAPREVSGRLKRQNHAEAEAIAQEIRNRFLTVPDGEDDLSIAVLTPYKNQAKLIRRVIQERLRDTDLLYQVEVLNTHLAQGREWDIVMFSVADTGSLPKNKPWFTDSNREEARALLNTTISRAKTSLIVFIDSQYWGSLSTPSLLADVVRSSSGVE